MRFTPNSRNYASLLALIAVLAVGAILAWAGKRDYDNFKSYQREIMAHSVDGVADQITYLIEDYEAALRIFVERHEALLGRLVRNPADEAVHSKIGADLKRYFPDYFSFTIADANGQLIYDDLGEKVGDLCRKDIKKFIDHQYRREIYVHPGPDEYHIDIMIPWYYGAGRTGVFFVSFKPKLFARLLDNSQVVGHRLYLIRRDTSDLIEIGSEGSRIDFRREIRLDAAELERIGYSKDVVGTRWKLIDVPDEKLFQTRRDQIILNGVTSFAAFLLIAGILVLLIRREERRRSAAEHALRDSHHKLETRVEARTSELRVANDQLRHEIEERNLAQQQLAQLASVVEQTDDVVIITDPKGKIEYVNPAFERLTGFSASEAVGKTPALLKSNVHPLEFYQQLWGTIVRGQVFRDVLINRKKDGSTYYEQKTITPLKDTHGVITHFVSTGKDISGQMEAQQRLNYLAHHDALTGLPNRALLADRLAHAMTHAQRNNRLIAVMILDLDRFKTINDTLGHAMGDELLKQVAERLTGCLRKGDTIARLGGDEFALVLEGLNHTDGASTVADKIMQKLSTPFYLGRRELFVSASIGITIYPSDDIDMDHLLKNADTAMYRAKDSGRNNYQFFSRDMMARATERLDLEGLLRHALERNEFFLHYQPRIRIDTGELIGVEALLRWNNPERGLIPPDKFIPLLEETGLIVPVGEWVLQQACGFNRVMHEAGFPPVRVAVNLSARQFRDKGLVDVIARTLRATGVEARYLELEITESLLMENIDAVENMLAAINEMGIYVAIDDFGTGYSSMAYLKRFTINAIKIDRSFIRDVMSDPDVAILVEAIIAMTRALRLEVTAEGVETAEQLEFLRKRACHEAQGFLFSRPLALEALIEWRQQHTAQLMRFSGRAAG